MLVMLACFCWATHIQSPVFALCGPKEKPYKIVKPLVDGKRAPTPKKRSYGRNAVMS